MTAQPQATIVITTRNRKEDLRRALDSAFAQTLPVEVIVTDDASDDGTADMVAAEFPAARVLRSEVCVGLIAQRTLAARSATTNHIFSIDDDAEFGSTDTVERTLAEFGHPQVGAVAIPHVDTLTGRVVNAPAPADGVIRCVASYTGTAHALRRDVFLQLGGYREDMVHQGEEGDYCIRMLAAGFVTRLGGAPLIQHHESPRRSFERMDFFGRRNDVLFGWRYAPARWLWPHLLATTVNGLRIAFKTGRLRSHGRGMIEGWRQILCGKARREPVDAGVYALFRRLKKTGPLRIAEIESSLPSLVPVATHE